LQKKSLVATKYFLTCGATKSTNLGNFFCI
jgi:hypothetical protein